MDAIPKAIYNPTAQAIGRFCAEDHLAEKPHRIFDARYANRVYPGPQKHA
jgi:hypothetical protein